MADQAIHQIAPEPASEPVPAEAGADTGQKPDQELVLDDLLVEDVSIDGMCGVY